MFSFLTSTVSSLAKLIITVDQADWSGTYDRIEVWRSVLGVEGPYEELSGSAWLQALLPATAASPSTGSPPTTYANVAGLELDLLVNQVYPIKVVFTGTNSLTFADIIGQINAAAAPFLVAYLDKNLKLALRTVQAGGLSAIQVVGGSAVPLLGLTVGDLEYGYDPRIVLAQGVTQYVFQDYFSSPTYFYKTRFLNSRTQAVSAFSDPFSTMDRLNIDPSQVVIGYAQLTTPQGRASDFQEILVYYSYLAQQVAGATIVGSPRKYLTDQNGYVEFPLVRGITVDVSVGGTPFIRTVSVPTDPTVLRFNVFDPAYGSDDNFSVQGAQLEYASRTKL